jgi:hypothetical protein
MALRDWAGPYVEQAGEDLRAARAAQLAACPSAFCMLLQMTFEKLGKAAFARRTPVAAGFVEPPHSHRTATRLLQYLALSPGGAPLAPSPAVSAAIWELELSHPAVVTQMMQQGGPQTPQLEFPWTDPATGDVHWPARHLPLARRAASPQDPIGAHLMRFADAIRADFDVLFPPHPP